MTSPPASEEAPLAGEWTLVSEEAALAGRDVPPSSAERPLGRGDAIGRYLLLDLLGRGAMGEVFRAYDPDLDRRVAVKLLRSHDRLLDEAKAMARIDHPNVITVHSVGMQGDAVFIAMELVDGPSLDRWLKTERARGPILDVLIEAARGLAAAHAAGVVHRDFKPTNVLVTTDGRAKVGDFGLADLEERTASPPSGETATGRAMGTPAYMSPEHVAGVGIDAHSDQFSFAITLYEALYGTRPFSGSAWPQLATQIASGEVVPELAKRRTGIDRIIRRALRVDPAERFPSMDALIVALERARRPAWRRWALVGGAGLVAGGLALGRGEPVEACEPGAARAEASWAPSDTTPLRVGGSDYASAFSARARIQLEHALDDYATQWAAAYDASCAAVGPHAQRGTPAERATAQCLDNRLESLQGLAELATTEQVDAGKVSELIATLPAIADCTSGQWVPYPSDPAKAAVTAELHRTLMHIHLARFADHTAEVRDDASTLVARARELGEPYLLARVLSEQARLLPMTNDAEQADAEALLVEALALAIGGGFDRLTGRIVNDLLIIVPSERKAASPRELAHVAAMARGLVEHGGGDEELLGNLSINEAGIMRRASRLDQAVVLDQRAVEHFRRIDDHEGEARARINQAVTAIMQGSSDTAIPQLMAVVETLERKSGTSPLTFQGRTILVQVLNHAGRTAEGHTAAARAYEDARGLYAPGSKTLRQATAVYAGSALNVGDEALGRELLSSLRALPASVDEACDTELIALGFLQLEGRHQQVLQEMPSLRERFASASSGRRLWLEITFACSAFLLGDQDLGQEILDELLAQRDLMEQRQEHGILAMLMVLAAVSDAPPPPGTTWGEQQPDLTGLSLLARQLAAVVKAMSSEEDPVPTVRRIRNELVPAYDERDINIQLLDAWLAAQEPTSP